MLIPLGQASNVYISVCICLYTATVAMMVVVMVAQLIPVQLPRHPFTSMIVYVF